MKSTRDCLGEIPPKNRQHFTIAGTADIFNIFIMKLRTIFEWLFYSGLSFLLIFPFFTTEVENINHQLLEHISASLLLGMLFGLLNKISSQLAEIINKK